MVTVRVNQDDVEAGAAVAYRLCQAVGWRLSKVELREIWSDAKAPAEREDA